MKKNQKKTVIDYSQFGYYRVTLCSPQVEIANLRFNADKIISLSKSAADSQAAVVLFPELGLTGYTCEDLFHNSKIQCDVRIQIKRILAETSMLKCVVVFGSPYPCENGRFYNCAFVCFGGKILGVIPKSFPPNYKEFYEMRWFVPGNRVEKECHDKIIGQNFLLSRKQLFKIGEMVFGVEICEDLWSPIPPSSNMGLAGTNVILNLSASNELVGKSEYRKELIKQQSARINAAYLYTSAAVGESTKDVVFGGHIIAAENGAILCENERFSLQDSVVNVDVDVERLQLERAANTTFGHSPVKLFKTHYLDDFNYNQKSLNRSYSRTPFVPATDHEVEKRVSDVFAIQSMGLVRRILCTDSKCVYLGLSGGLDSTLALLVCLEMVKKLGKGDDYIRCVTMPGLGTSSRTKNSAHALAKAFGVSLKEIPIQEAVRLHFRDIGHDEKVINNTYENAQARERTKILFDKANDDKGIVVGTGNLSEMALGWATYNADHISHYGVNCSIPKTLVKYLISYYAKTRANEEQRIVLQDILETVVSPELTPIGEDGKIQSTEDLIGPYELNDFFLFHFERNGFSPKKIHLLADRTFREKYSLELIRKHLLGFFDRFLSQQFKRTTSPPGPKVGSVSLSPRGDWRMPDEVKFKNFITNVAEEVDYE